MNLDNGSRCIANGHEWHPRKRLSVLSNQEKWALRIDHVPASCSIRSLGTSIRSIGGGSPSAAGSEDISQSSWLLWG